MPATQAQVTHGSGQARPAAGYDHIRELLAGERCVLLDGGIATQLAGATDQAPRPMPSATASPTASRARSWTSTRGSPTNAGR